MTTTLTPEQATDVRHRVNSITQDVRAAIAALAALNFGDATTSAEKAERLGDKFIGELTAIITPPVA